MWNYLNLIRKMLLHHKIKRAKFIDINVRCDGTLNDGIGIFSK